MSLILDIVSWAALVAGGFFMVVAGIGLHRLPDLFSRTHAVSVGDTLGVGLLTVGMLLQTDDWGVAARLAIILVVLYTTGAVAVHALARAALHAGERPLLAGIDGVLRPVEVSRLYPDLGARLQRPLISEQVEGSMPLPVPPDEGIEPGQTAQSETAQPEAAQPEEERR
jgi:multicomponent Na+:H+ antiporter subunit G